MHRRTTYLIFGALGLLLLLWAGQAWLAQRRQAQNPSGTPLVANLPWETISRIEIIRDGQTTVIERQPDGWMVQLASGVLPAEPAAVEQLRNALGRATVTAIAAHAQDTPDAFGLDSARRTSLRLTANGVVVGDVALGLATDDQLSSYAVRAGDPRIYLVSGLAPADVRADWRDHEALTFDHDTATAVRYTLPRGSFSLTKGTDGEWQLDGQPADQTEAAGLIRTLSAVRVLDFPSNHATFTPSGISLEVTTASSTVGLTFGPATREGGVIVKNHRGFVYTLSKDAREHILPARRTLLP